MLGMLQEAVSGRDDETLYPGHPLAEGSRLPDVAGQGKVIQQLRHEDAVVLAPLRERISTAVDLRQGAPGAGMPALDEGRLLDPRGTVMARKPEHDFIILRAHQPLVERTDPLKAPGPDDHGRLPLDEAVLHQL